MKDSQTLRERVIEAGMTAWHSRNGFTIPIDEAVSYAIQAAARTALEAAKEQIDQLYERERVHVRNTDRLDAIEQAAEEVATLLADLGVGSHGIERVCEQDKDFARVEAASATAPESLTTAATTEAAREAFEAGRRHEAKEQAIERAQLGKRHQKAVERAEVAEDENQRLWSVVNALVAKADPCACTHDDENCCAKVGEDCISCAIAVAFNEVGSEKV